MNARSLVVSSVLKNDENFELRSVHHLSAKETRRWNNHLPEGRTVADPEASS